MSTTNQKVCADPSCCFAKISLILGDVWNLQIINQLLQSESVRFSEMTENINGLSNSVLSARLKNLAEQEIIERDTITSVPPQVLYRLTVKGEAMKPIFDQILKSAQSLYS